MELSVFEQVADAVHAMMPDDLGHWGYSAHRRGIKVWFGDERNREHYEAQMIPRRLVDGSDGMAIEVGFHAEGRDMADNDAAVALLLQAEKKWRRALGDEAEAGPFLGRPEDWRRVSEAWLDVDLDDDELVMDIACRLTDYISALEPIRQASL